MMDYYELDVRSSYQDSLKVLEADIQHANMLAASIPRGKGGSCLQMKLVYNHLAPIFLFLLQCLDCSCTCLLSSYLNLYHIVVYKVCSDGRPNVSSYGRKATIREFYTVILPSLQRLHCNSSELDITQEEDHSFQMVVRKRLEDKSKLSDVDMDREDECGICLEPCTKMVLPNCCHSMCINCYHDWNTRSESCPFCRGSLKRVNSEDLWVLTCGHDVVDTQTVLKEDMLRFYLYINSLPKDIPDALFVMHYEYLM
ncbi:zf-C3HC4_2 domain-containing protein [Cephalotus follicularis]|uniref:Zf-C3HC4_2 domain-containing protein n=1 Tax=Cephalotus follicularis TaxID=3775 RepID=A0A1Q3B774_CEPFO|nr:zf-C3HC4_2 domain-containing protein [Cephalotus follicularis]